jgi:serine/threonine protein kinase
MYPFSANNLWGLTDVIKKRARIEVENLMEGIDSFPLDLRDFIFQCLQMQPNLRASAQDLLQHPFIQKYVVDQCNESKDATCISNYSKQNDEFYKELDLEKSLDAVFVRFMEEKLLQVWIDPCDVSLTLKSLSASDLQFLSQQLNIEVEFTTKLYDEKMVSMNVALKHCVQVNRLNNKMLKPNAIISQTIRELANNHAVILKATDVKDTDNQPKFTEDVNKSLKSNQNRKSHHITSQDKFDGSKSYENLFKLLLKCRIPEVDAQKYANTFIDMGYDDMQSIQEDLDSETLNGIMKPGHIIRFLKDDNDYEINQVKDNRAQVEESKFQNDLKKILELPNEFNEALKIKPIKHHPGLNKEKNYLLKIKQDSASEYSSKTVFGIIEVNRGDWYITIGIFPYQHYKRYYYNYYNKHLLDLV